MLERCKSQENDFIAGSVMNKKKLLFRTINQNLRSFCRSPKKWANSDFVNKKQKRDINWKLIVQILEATFFLLISTLL